MNSPSLYSKEGESTRLRRWGPRCRDADDLFAWVQIAAERMRVPIVPVGRDVASGSVESAGSGHSIAASSSSRVPRTYDTRSPHMARVQPAWLLDQTESHAGAARPLFFAPKSRRRAGRKSGNVGNNRPVLAFDRPKARTNDQRPPVRTILADGTVAEFTR